MHNISLMTASTTQLNRFDYLAFPQQNKSEIILVNTKVRSVKATVTGNAGLVLLLSRTP